MAGFGNDMSLEEIKARMDTLLPKIQEAETEGGRRSAEYIDLSNEFERLRTRCSVLETQKKAHQIASQLTGSSQVGRSKRSWFSLFCCCFSKPEDRRPLLSDEGPSG